MSQNSPNNGKLSKRVESSQSQVQVQVKFKSSSSQVQVEVQVQHGDFKVIVGPH